MSVCSRVAVLLCLTACQEEANKPPGLLDADGDGSDEETDCDDTDPAVHPGAQEVCNALDDDCDGQIDDQDPDRIGGDSWPVDNDGDGYLSSDPQDVVLACEAPPGEPGDCDDSNATVSPASEEASTANDIDDDCNGWADETAEDFADAIFYRASGAMDAQPQRLGDVDGDGVEDFTPDGESVYLGGLRRLGELEVTETRDLALLGGKLQSASDQDGDGLFDLWVQSDEIYLVLDIPSLLGGSAVAADVASAWTEADGGTILGWGQGDLDGDGVVDFGLNAFDYDWIFSTIYAMPGGMQGALGPGLALGEIHGPDDFMLQSAVLPDLDGDGLGELYTSDAATIGLWTAGLAPSSAHSEAPRQIAGLWWIEDTADVDGDGQLDLLGCNDSDQICHVLRYADIPEGASTLEAVAWVTLPGLTHLAALDLNGDGLTDLVGTNRHDDDGAGAVYLFDGASLPGDGTLETSEAIGRWQGRPGSALGWKLHVAGDVDADGHDDLLVASYGSPTEAGQSLLVYGGPPAP